MACSLTIAGRGIACKDALGGIKNVWIGLWSDGIWAAPSSGAISDATATLDVFQFSSLKGAGSFTQTINSSVENGTIYFTQVVSFSCGHLVAADITELSEITKGRMAVIVEDNNGNRFVMGHTRGCEASGGSVVTGAGLGDLNGFTLEITAEELIPAPFGPTVDATYLDYNEV